MKLPAWIERALTPIRRRRGARRFDAAQYNRLTASWVQAERSINTELRGDLDALRRRSRDLAKNSPLAKKFIDMCVANIVGPAGFSFQARIVEGQAADDIANKAVESAWADWCRPGNCDIAGRLSFNQFSRAVVRALARDGEALVRRRFDANNPYAYSIQLLDVERLDTTLWREASQGENAIILGVEIDANGRPVAYWLLAAPVGRDPTARQRVRVPASEIIHIYLTEDPEQIRGIPWMHAAMLAVNDLKGYNHAAIVAARIGASKMGFFVLPDGDTTRVSDGTGANDGIPFTEVEAGQFGVIHGEGADFKSFNPDYPHQNYASFVKEHKRDVATGFGVAYNALANDLEGVNFSSIRAGTLEEREHWMTAQDEVIQQFCELVFADWIDTALLAGAITMPNGSALPAAKRRKFSAHVFQGRRWSWVDPLKDVEASVTAINNGLASPYTIIAQQGLDADDVLADIAKFQKTAKDKGALLVVATPPQPAATGAADPASE